MPSAASGPSALAPTRLTWGLFVATLNRIDSLEECVRCALAQTRRPHEIVIVDASVEWQAHHRRIAALTAEAGVSLTYLQAARKSLTVQRNQAVAAGTADICFLIDDDSFMHPDCADEIMHVYEQDGSGRILSVAASDAPPHSEHAVGAARKAGGIRNGKYKLFLKSALFRWFWRNIALMGAEKVFIPYNGPFQRDIPQELTQGLPVVPVSLSSGYKMTARREAVLAHPFEEAFQSYSPAEDLDFFYRVSRPGFLVRAVNARLYHHEVAATRIKRQTATLLSITNIAYLVRKHSRQQARHQAMFIIMLMRRLLAELIKDVGSRRWRLDQFRAVLRAFPISLKIFRLKAPNLQPWYEAKQLQLLHR